MVRKQQKPLKAKLPADHAFFDIIAEAYRVFAYPKPTSLEVYEDIGMYADIAADFFNPPIKELPLHYIRDWYWATHDPKGIAKSIWGYLLPRIFEIRAFGEDLNNTGHEVALSRFETGNPDNLTSDEWKIIDKFQRLFLTSVLERKLEDECLDDTVCMFKLGGWPLEDLLDQIASSSDIILAQQFWADWCEGVVPGRESVWTTAFWESSDQKAVLEFYTSNALRIRMENLALSDDTDPDIAAKASAVVVVIEAALTKGLSS